MSNNKVEVWPDSSKTEDDVWGLTGFLRRAEEEADNFGAALDEAVNPDTAELGDVFATLQEMAGTLDNAVEKMGELVALMSPKEGSFFDSLLGGVETFNTLADGREKLEGIGDSINDVFEAFDEGKVNKINIFKGLFSETFDASKNIGVELNNKLEKVPGVISGAWEKVSTTIPNIWSNLKSKFDGDGASIGESAGKMLQPIQGAFKGLNSVISGIGWGVIIAAVAALAVFIIQNWDAIKATIGQAAEWVNVNIIQPIVGFFAERLAFVQSVFTGINEFLQNIFAKDWTEQFGAFGNVLNAFFANVENIWNSIKSIFNGVVTFVKSVFAGDWQGAWDAIVGIFSGIWEGIVAYVKRPINTIIGFINGLISGIVGGINLVIGALNKISIEIPDWDIFGSLAGKRFGFDFALLNAPQIPYLAKGAVLPANKPFLAMVGDQKHGTNVEAPLATIQGLYVQEGNQCPMFD